MAPDDKRVIRQFCWEVIFGLVMAVIAVSIIKTESWLSSALLFIVVWIFSFCVAMYKDAEENEKEDKEKRKTRRKSRSRSRSDSDDDRLPTGWNGTDEIMVTAAHSSLPRRSITACGSPLRVTSGHRLMGRRSASISNLVEKRIRIGGCLRGL